MNLKTYLLVFSCLVLSVSCSSDDSDDLDPRQNDCPISQGISPNNDGLNDNFDLSCLADRTGISLLEIFDRNGIKIFERSNYRDEFIGQNDDGDDLITGTYFYSIAFEAEDPEYGLNTEGSIYVNVEEE